MPLFPRGSSSSWNDKRETYASGYVPNWLYYDFTRALPFAIFDTRSYTFAKHTGTANFRLKNSISFSGPLVNKIS